MEPIKAMPRVLFVRPMPLRRERSRGIEEEGRGMDGGGEREIGGRGGERLEGAEGEGGMD
jgi:hypothetical protein